MLGALAVLAVAVVHAAGPVVVRDLDEHVWTPLSPVAGETNLVFFIGADCPITRRYSPEMDRIAADYRSQGLHTWFVYADPALSPAGARRNLTDFHAGSTVPAVIDAHFALTMAAGITVTPEAVVYTSAGRMYRGRIDDLYVAIGQSRRAATVHDLRDALDAVLVGKPVARAETRPVGCFVERPVK
jgi:hypothetical protein